MVGKILKTTEFNDKILNIEFMNLKKLNAISRDMLIELDDLFSKKKYIKKFLLITFQGHNNGPFSSGADLSDISSFKEVDQLKDYQKKLNKVLKNLKSIDIPTISLINSYCYGAGLLIALHTDITIANFNAEFSIPAVKLGINIPKTQLNHIYAKNINNFFLKDILITGRKFKAEEAYNAKMLSHVIKKNFQKECKKYISQILPHKSSILNYYSN